MGNPDRCRMCYFAVVPGVSCHEHGTSLHDCTLTPSQHGALARIISEAFSGEGREVKGENIPRPPFSRPAPC